MFNDIFFPFLQSFFYLLSSPPPPYEIDRTWYEYDFSRHAETTRSMTKKPLNGCWDCEQALRAVHFCRNPLFLGTTEGIKGPDGTQNI